MSRVCGVRGGRGVGDACPDSGESGHVEGVCAESPAPGVPVPCPWGDPPVCGRAAPRRLPPTPPLLSAPSWAESGRGHSPAAARAVWGAGATGASGVGASTGWNQ